MKLRVKRGLLFATVHLYVNDQWLILENVVVDTGSASSVFSADKLFVAGLTFEPGDTLKRVYGVGGSEFVFAKRVKHLRAGELMTSDIEITVGAMDYGIELDGILGMDFLQQVGALIDLKNFLLVKSG